MAGTRVRWHPRAFNAFAGSRPFQDDVDERALAIGVQAEATASDTAVIAVDSGPTRETGRARAAVIAYDVPGRRTDTFAALLAAVDAGR